MQTVAPTATLGHIRQVAEVGRDACGWLVSDCRLLARNGPVGPVRRCPFIEVDRKRPAECQNDAIDPTETLLLIGRGPIGVASDYIKRFSNHPIERGQLKNKLEFNGQAHVGRHLSNIADQNAARSVEPNEVEMDTPIKAKPVADLRDYLAEERTFLAWIRTGITLMGFGFVVARYGIFLEQLHLPQQFSAPQPHEFSPWFGAALTGALVNLFSVRRFMRLAGEVDWNQFADRSLSRQGVFMASFLALVGIALTICLILFLAQAPDAAFASIAIGK
jgi:inner membrane protein YidH